MTGDQPSTDDILAGFAATFRNDPAELARYCLAYPSLSTQFVALAHEIALQQARAGDAPLDEATERWIESACEAHTRPAADPFAGLSGKPYQALRQTLDVPSVVLNAFRDRLVAGGTVPLAFLERLAGGLGTGLGELAAYLAGPPKLARTISHKSDGVPGAAAGKMSFADVLVDAGVSPDRKAALLADED